MKSQIDELASAVDPAAKFCTMEVSVVDLPPPWHELWASADSPRSRLHATGGTSHSLDLAAAAFGAAPGDAVLMTSPTYFLAADIFRSRGLELARAPTCARSGPLDVGAPARLLAELADPPAELRAASEDLLARWGDLDKVRPRAGHGLRFRVGA